MAVIKEMFSNEYYLLTCMCVHGRVLPHNIPLWYLLHTQMDKLRGSLCSTGEGCSPGGCSRTSELVEKFMLGGGFVCVMISSGVGHSWLHVLSIQGQDVI